MPARIVVLATANWLGSPRLPAGLKRAGFEVAVLCPSGNRLLLTRHADLRVEIKTGMTIANIRTLLMQLATDWQAGSVIPADEGAVNLLHRFAGQAEASESVSTSAALVQMLRRSLPPSAHFKTLRSKLATYQLARDAGVAVPAQGLADSLTTALAFAKRQGYPVVLKPEQGAAGLGIAICLDEATLRHHYQQFVERQKTEPEARLLMQAHVPGADVSHPFVAADGKLLTGLTRLKLCAHPRPTSPSSVVELVELPTVAEATRRLVAACGYNGFGSVQFLLDAKGAPQFIEFNTRPVPVMHMGESLVGIDWCASWHAAVQGTPQPPFKGTPIGRKIALFPQELIRDAQSPYLSTEAVHDVPWDDLMLLRSYLAPPPEPAKA